jgi:hypothetical protein
MIYAKKIREISLKKIADYMELCPDLTGLISNGSIADMDFCDVDQSIRVDLVIPNEWQLAGCKDRVDEVIKAKTFDCQESFEDIWEDNCITRAELLISWLYHHNHLHLDGEGELRLKLDLYL